MGNINSSHGRLYNRPVRREANAGVAADVVKDVAKVVSAAVVLGAIAAAAYYQHESSLYKQTGIVREGADGRYYVVPDDGVQPEYASKQACVDDVTKQISTIEGANSQAISDTPDQLCQPADASQGPSYVPGVSTRGWLGPIVNGKSKWTSVAVEGWEPVTDGSFAGNGYVQSSIQLAPAGLHDGTRTTISDSNEGGFGEHDDSGFGEDGSHMSGSNHGFGGGEGEGGEGGGHAGGGE